MQLHITITTVDVWLTRRVYYALCFCGRTRWRARGRASTDTLAGWVVVGGHHHLPEWPFPHTFLYILHYKQPCFCHMLPFLSNNPVFIFVYSNDHVFSPV